MLAGKIKLALVATLAALAPLAAFAASADPLASWNDGVPKRAIVACARQSVVLTDSSKLGLDTTVRFASTAEIDVLVTDDGADAEDLALLRAEGLEVVIASGASQ